jgi:hypothetical protein
MASLRRYISSTILSGRIDREIDKARQMLIAEHKYPEGPIESQLQRIIAITRVFKVLLTEKSRQERIQKISNDNCGSTQYGSASITDYATGGISVRDILKKKIAWGGKRNNHDRKKEGYIQSCLGKHETKGRETRFETGRHA